MANSLSLTISGSLTVNVLGQTYSLEGMTERMSSAADALGYCDHESLEIFVAVHMPEQKIAEVVLHELFHCLMSAMHSGEESNEERQVDRLGRGFACLMRDNPELFGLLAEAVK